MLEEGSSKEDDDLFSEDLSDSGFGGYGDVPTPMERHSDLLKSLTDFSPFLKTMVAEWLGMVWSADEEKYVKDDGVDPIMNVKGARWCVNFLRVYTRDNNILTTIDKDEYNDIMSDVIDVAILNIGTRAEKFGINNNGDILLVSNQLIHAASLVLMGAGGNKTYTDFLGTAVNRNESVNVSPGQGMPMPMQNQAVFPRSVNWFNKTKKMLFGK